MALHNSGEGPLLADLGGNWLRKKQIGPVNPFPSRGSPLTSKIVLDRGTGIGQSRRERVNPFLPDRPFIIVLCLILDDFTC